MKPKKPKEVIAPEGCIGHLTPGKEYKVIGLWDSIYTEKYGHRIIIIDDIGNEILCFEKRCSFLNEGNWIIKKYER